MPALKPVVWFFLKVLLLYVFFLVVHGEAVYAAVFRACGNGVYATMGDGGRVRLAKTSGAAGEHDTQVTLTNMKVRGARGRMEITTRTMGYLPTAFAVALVLATPLPLKRLIPALGLALLLISCFVGFQFYLRLVDVLSQPDPLNVYHLGAFMKAAVRILIKTLSLTPVTGYIAPVFCWIIVVFRGDQLSMLASLCRGEPAVGSAASEPRGH